MPNGHTAHYVTGRNLLHLTCDSDGGSPPGGGGGGPSDDSGLLSGASMRQLDIPLALSPEREPLDIVKNYMLETHEFENYLFVFKTIKK